MGKPWENEDFSQKNGDLAIAEMGILERVRMYDTEVAEVGLKLDNQAM